MVVAGREGRVLVPRLAFADACGIAPAYFSKGQGVGDRGGGVICKEQGEADEVAFAHQAGAGATEDHS